LPAGLHRSFIEAEFCFVFLPRWLSGQKNKTKLRGNRVRRYYKQANPTDLETAHVCSLFIGVTPLHFAARSLPKSAILSFEFKEWNAECQTLLIKKKSKIMIMGINLIAYWRW